MTVHSAPENCCPECFAHAWLRQYATENSVETGDCDYCGSKRVPLIEVNKLTDSFSNLTNGYTRREDSIDRLIYLVQEDWHVFSDRVFGVEGDDAIPLLNDIMRFAWDDDDGEEPVRGEDYYSTRPSEWHQTTEEKWQQFSDEVKAGQTPTVGTERFQDMEGDWHNAVESGRPFELLFQDVQRVATTLRAGTPVYRVRAGFHEDDDGSRRAYEGQEIGAPPIEKAVEQRLSREGDVVFYCADQEATAIAESRPAKGYVVSVSRWSPREDLRIVDLTKEPWELNPFTEESLRWFLEFHDFLRLLGEQMGRPLERGDDQSDYRPCQEAADRIRESYDGIRYQSAMRPDGTNLVLFEPSKVQFETSRLVRISHVVVTPEEYAGQPALNLKSAE